jgi:metal-responsive CopG/Arc/MetJ family transcriptional regulator
MSINGADGGGYLMVRIQLDLPDDQVAELDKLMEETRLTTRKDLFNNALTLFLWAVKAKKAGRIIASVDEDHRIRELVMPSIENIKAEKTLQPS